MQVQRCTNVERPAFQNGVKYAIKVITCSPFWGLSPNFASFELHVLDTLFWQFIWLYQYVTLCNNNETWYISAEWVILMACQSQHISNQSSLKHDD